MRMSWQATVGCPSGPTVVRAVAPGTQAQPARRVSPSATSKQRPPAPQATNSHSETSGMSASQPPHSSIPSSMIMRKRSTSAPAERRKTGSEIISSALRRV